MAVAAEPRDAYVGRWQAVALPASVAWEAAIADAPRSWGEVVDVCPVQEVVLKFLLREAVGGFVGALSQQAYCTDIGLLGTLSLATEVEGGHHLLTQGVLTQGGHEVSPLVK